MVQSCSNGPGCKLTCPCKHTKCPGESPPTLDGSFDIIVHLVFKLDTRATHMQHQQQAIDMFGLRVDAEAAKAGRTSIFRMYSMYQIEYAVGQFHVFAT